MMRIKLDAAALAQFQSADGVVTLCDEAGNPVRRLVVRPLPPLDQEPQYTEEEWRAIMSDPRRYTTAQVLGMLRGGAK